MTLKQKGKNKLIKANVYEIHEGKLEVYSGIRFNDCADRKMLTGHAEILTLV